jgi:hypothetical protein
VLALAAVAALGVLAAPDVAAAPVAPAPSRIRLDLDQLSPRMITSADPAVLVTGRITNTGDRKISDLAVRVQVGDVLAGDDKVRAALASPAQTDRAHGAFRTISPVLQPGQSARVEVSVPLHGPNSLEIDKPGIYPLLVNVNGEPDFGDPARLAALNVLLPVLSVPGPQPPRAPPAQLTMLWPLVDEAPRVLGSIDGQPLLGDDFLAGSLASGRLYTLVNALRQADPATLQAICVAVDPDLLDTVDGMTRGYHVAGAGGATPGTGAQAARQWLDELRILTKDRCVLPLPYADADLVALSRAGTLDLTKLALSGSISAHRLLPTVHWMLPDARILDNVVWPAEGAADPRAIGDLAGLGATSLLLDGGNLATPTTGSPVKITSGSRALPTDRLVGAGFAVQPQPGTITPADASAVALQDGLAALVQRTAFNTGTQAVLIAPPRRWNVPAAELTTFLGALRTLTLDGLITPVALPARLDVPPLTTVPASEVAYPPGAVAAEIAPTVVTEVLKENGRQLGLQEAMRRDDTRAVEPGDLIDPLRLGLLRATSSAWRPQPALGLASVGAVRSSADAMARMVTVARSNQPIALASEDSRIPVSVSNTLPVAMNVRIRFAESPGVQPTQFPDTRIPAGSSRTLWVPAKIVRSGRFAVDVGLTTPGGNTLGDPARLQLTSTVYGTITLAVTGTAFGVLLLLSARRVYRRIRAARQAEHTPAPAEPEKVGVVEDVGRG